MPRDYVHRKNPPVPLTIIERRRVEENLGLVGGVAREIRWHGLTYEEIFSAGSLGLCRASQTFDEDRGVKFSTYAHEAILRAMLDEIRDRRMIHVPKCRPGGFAEEWDNAQTLRVQSITGSDGDYDVTAPTTDRGIHDTTSGRIDALAAAMSALDRREKAIVRGMMEGLSGVEIGHRVGLTRSAISKIQRHILSALRHEILSRESQAG